MFSKLLIANRGEIAVRVMQACAELGIRSVAVYSDADAGALHVRRADESYRIGPAPAAQSYLRVDAILDAARRSGAQAIHPGYGFLSENAAFSQACRDAGITFVGPSPEAMRRLGSKRDAKLLARASGVPVVPGYDGEAQDDETLLNAAKGIGFPLLIKASAGGGGRGMRVVRGPEEFQLALDAAKREARAAFGDDVVLLERLIERPRHVEIQVLADAHGNVVYLGERDCSVQRRHQKVVEESPSPALTPALREAMGAAAVALVRASGYVNAGTVEFVIAPSEAFYFLEVNTRLQVEHPVTEQVTGIDLVQEQIRIAAGLPLALRQEDVYLRGHAIECRVYAEDAAQGFRPSTGSVRLFAPPNGPGMRNDVGVETGDEVTAYYDPLLAKLIVSAPDRESCIRRALVALRRYAVLGITANVPFLQAVIDSHEFRRGAFSTDLLDRRLPEMLSSMPQAVPERVWLAAAAWRLTAPATMGGEEDNPWRSGALSRGGSPAQTLRLALVRDRELPPLSGPDTSVTALSMRPVSAPPSASPAWVVDLPEGQHEIVAGRGRPGEVWVRQGVHSWRAWVAEADDCLFVCLDGVAYQLRLPHGLRLDDVEAHPESHRVGGALEAPLPGVVARIAVEEGETVDVGQTVVVLEAMKTEVAVAAPYAGIVRRLVYRAGDLVVAGATLGEIEPRPAGEREGMPVEGMS